MEQLNNTNVYSNLTEMSRLDLFANKAGNYNAVICGDSGCGKTRIVSATIRDAVANGDLVVVLDIGGQYHNLCNDLNGKYIYLKDMPKINPFIMNDSIPDPDGYIDILVDLLGCILGIDQELPFFNRISFKTMLRDAVVNLFNTSNFNSLSDIQTELKKSYLPETKYNPIIESMQDNELFNTLSADNIDIGSNKFIVFDLEGVDLGAKNNQLYVYALLVNILNTAMKCDMSQRKHLIIDEFWDIFISKHSEDDSDPSIKFNLYGFDNFIETLSRKLRVVNGSMITISQSIKDFNSSSVGNVFLNQSDYKLFFTHRHSLELFNDYCDPDLVSSLTKVIKDGTVYQEGLFLTPKGFIEQKIEKIYYPLKRECNQ